MSEKYTPDEAELIGCYAGAMEEQAGRTTRRPRQTLNRGTAKIKSDALRVAAIGVPRKSTMPRRPRLTKRETLALTTTGPGTNAQDRVSGCTAAPT